MPDVLKHRLSYFLKPFFWLTSLLILIIFLSGCSLLPGAKQEKIVTLKYWGLWEPATTVNQIIDDYKKIKPNVNIDIRFNFFIIIDYLIDSCRWLPKTPVLESNYFFLFCSRQKRATRKKNYQYK